MADIFQEVDEIIKQERMERFWKENARLIIAFIVITIVGTACISFYKSWNTSVKQAQTTTLIALFDKPDFAQNAVEDTADLRGGLRGIGLLGAAKTAQENNDTELALKNYKAAAEDNNIPDEFRSLADLMVVKLSSDLNAKQKLDILQSISSDDESPWKSHARIEAALIYAHDLNNFSEARKQLAEIKAGEAVAPGIIETAKKLDHVYAVQQSKTPSAKTEDDKS